MLKHRNIIIVIVSIVNGLKQQATNVTAGLHLVTCGDAQTIPLYWVSKPPQPPVIHRCFDMLYIQQI